MLSRTEPRRSVGELRRCALQWRSSVGCGCRGSSEKRAQRGGVASQRLSGSEAQRLSRERAKWAARKHPKASRELRKSQETRTKNPRRKGRRVDRRGRAKNLCDAGGRCEVLSALAQLSDFPRYRNGWAQIRDWASDGRMDEMNAIASTLLASKARKR